MIRVTVTGVDRGPIKLSRIINEALVGSRLVVSYYPKGTPAEDVMPAEQPNRIYIFDDTKETK